MGWSDMEARCKKHPSHRQSKGVCPSCLRERLAHLSAASSSTTTTTNGSSSSRTSIYLSDSNSNSPGAVGDSSPPVCGAQRVSRVKMAALLRARPEEPLTKSRSLAFVITSGDSAAADEIKGKKGGGASASASANRTKGFWARLMPGKVSRRRVDGSAAARDMDLGAAAFHSKTLKQTASARWVL